MTRLLCVIALVTACGGRPSAPAHPDTSASGGSAVATNPPPPATPRSDERSNDDCRRLVDHTVALADAERPAEHKLTADERSRLGTQLRERWAASCKTMTSGGYQCALAARTLAELDACGA